MESLIDGSGGVIVVDTQGRWGAARNTEMMSFAVASPAGLIEAGQ
jgi:isoaspartyl peptidase/L-asparaginase-like protein (Ntn-hydrolase superfamily)